MFLLIIQQEELYANEMVSEWGLHEPEFELLGKFQWNFNQGKGNLDRVSSEEFEFSEFELTV